MRTKILATAIVVALIGSVALGGIIIDTDETVNGDEDGSTPTKQIKNEKVYPPEFKIFKSLNISEVRYYNLSIESDTENGTNFMMVNETNLPSLDNYLFLTSDKGEIKELTLELHLENGSYVKFQYLHNENIDIKLRADNSVLKISVTVAAYRSRKHLYTSSLRSHINSALPDAEVEQ